MVGYRRQFVPGGTYFFTVALRDRTSDLLVRRIELLRESFLETHRRRPFENIATVVLPDHLHTIWRLPPSDHDYPGRWRALKAYFTRKVRAEEGRGLSPWQSRYWEHVVRDDRDLANHIHYVHYNPVKHGLVDVVAEWPYSSFHRFVARGLLPPDWAGPRESPGGEFGE